MTNQETASKYSVAHADHNLTNKHWQLIDELHKTLPEGQFFVQVISLTDAKLALPSALYGPSAGDEPVTEDQVHYKVRNERPGPSRLVDAPLRPAMNMVVIGLAQQRTITAYGTQSLSPSPREWWDTSMKPQEAYESALFWMEHALSSKENSDE